MKNRLSIILCIKNLSNEKNTMSWTNIPAPLTCDRVKMPPRSLALAAGAKSCLKKSSVEHPTYLDTLPLPILNQNKMLLWEVAFTEKNLNAVMMNMVQKKAPENDGLTKEFYSCFLGRIKRTFCYLH